MPDRHHSAAEGNGGNDQRQPALLRGGGPPRLDPRGRRRAPRRAIRAQPADPEARAGFRRAVVPAPCAGRRAHLGGRDLPASRALQPAPDRTRALRTRCAEGAAPRHDQPAGHRIPGAGRAAAGDPALQRTPSRHHLRGHRRSHRPHHRRGARGPHRHRPGLLSARRQETSRRCSRCANRWSP